MKQKIVVISQSPLGFLLSRELDRRLGPLIQTEISWLTPSRFLVHLPTTARLLGATKSAWPIPRLENVEIIHSRVQSVNLKARRIITQSKVVEFDYLVVDQTPAYLAEQLATISEQVQTLLAGLEAQFHLKKTPRARIYCSGQSAEAWQLALLLKADATRTHPRLGRIVEVLIDMPGNHLGRYLRHNGLAAATPTSLAAPGLTIQEPRTIVANQKITGLGLAAGGRAMVDGFGAPIGYPNVLMIDSAARGKINLWRTYQSEAKQIADGLVGQLEGRARRKLDSASPALLLSGEKGYFVAIGDWENHRIRARGIAYLERRSRLQVLEPS